jgi:magnesium and cobalt transporter
MKPKSKRGLFSRFFSGEPQTREELLDMLRQAEQDNLLDSYALSMIEGVMQVSQIQVRDIMVPRAQMTVVEISQNLQESLPLIINSGHSRFPVIEENRDEVLGILHAKDLLPYALGGSEKLELREILRPAIFIPESKPLNILLREFRRQRNHMAIVVDEYGGVDGLVTIEDVLEQIVGEIKDEFDIEEELAIRKISDHEFAVKAITPIEDFNLQFKTHLPNEVFDTIGGLVTNALGHMPLQGETVTIDDLHFEVLRADSRQIHLLKLTR